MFSCFQSAYLKEKINSHNSQLWWDLLTQINDVTEETSPFKEPESGIPRICYKVVKHKAFEALVFTVILCNLIAMTLIYEGSLPGWSNTIESLNIIFSSLFILECILKLSAFGFKEYFKDSWNKLEKIMFNDSIMFDQPGSEPS